MQYLHASVQYVASWPHLVQSSVAALLACMAAAAFAFPAIARCEGAAAVRIAGRVLLVASVLIVLEFTLKGTTSDSGSVNLVPTQGVAESIKASDVRNGLANVFGNIVMFAPLGFLAVLAMRRSLAVIAGLGGALSLLIEFTQFILGDRWSDVDDVLLNTTGTVLGAFAATASVAAVRRHRASRVHVGAHSRS